MNENLLMKFLFQFIFSIGSILLIYFGYKLLRFGTELQQAPNFRKEQNHHIFYSGLGPGLVFMILGAALLLISIFTIDSIGNPEQNRPDYSYDIFRTREDAILENLRESRQELQELKNEFNQSRSGLRSVQKNLNRLEEGQLEQQKLLGESSRKDSQYLALREEFQALIQRTDSLKSQKAYFRRIEQYLREQEAIVLKSIQMLETLSNRQNLLEQTMFQLHQQELGASGLELDGTDTQNNYLSNE